MRQPIIRPISVLAAVGAAACAAAGQQQPRDYEPRQRSQWRQQQQQHQQPRQGEWEPEAVSIVGLDLDGDGRTDTVYRISRFDYEQAMRQHIRERGGSGGPQQFGQRQRARQQQFRQGGWQEDEFSELPIAEDDSPQAPDNVELRGTVEAARTARLVGQGQAHQLVRLELDDGRNVFADLGPAWQLRDQNVRVNPGDEIEVTGKPAILNDKPVVFANRLRTDQGSITIHRGPRGSMQQVGGGMGMGGRAQAASHQLKDLSGTVQNKEEITIGDSEPYTLVRLRLNDGRTALVNLGPERELKDVNIERGDRLEVEASEVDLFGQPMFHAKKLSAGGRTHEIRQER